MTQKNSILCESIRRYLCDICSLGSRERNPFPISWHVMCVSSCFWLFHILSARSMERDKGSRFRCSFCSYCSPPSRAFQFATLHLVLRQCNILLKLQIFRCRVDKFSSFLIRWEETHIFQKKGLHVSTTSTMIERCKCFLHC